MGAGYIDYIVADRTVIPPHRRACYEERVVYLPDTYQVNDSTRPLPARTPTRSEVGLPAEGFVFCSFNQTYKITPCVFDAWMRLLNALEGSVLWLFSDDAATMRNLRQAAADRGVAPGRLVFAAYALPDDHLARYGVADLFLDTSPYCAHTTASDALWVGLPVVTCPGETFASRVAASLLHAIGVHELVAGSLAEYEQLALTLARDRGRLAALRARIIANRRTHPLFDTTRFARHLEAAYRTMHEIALRGESPRAFAVEAIDAGSAV
jgi:predicted O-linked N-acetylglucosamine transferase (SPINDLY family)